MNSLEELSVIADETELGPLTPLFGVCLFRNASYSPLCTITRASVPELLQRKVTKETIPAIQGLMEEVRDTKKRFLFDNEEKADTGPIPRDREEFGGELTFIRRV